MKHQFYAALATVVLTGTLLSSAAMAQDAAGTAAAPTTATAPAAPTAGATDPGHPRVNQIDKRIENQQKRIDAGVADGQLTKKEAARDEKSLDNKEKKLSADEAKNGGHITKAEEKNLNKGLNKNSRRIHRQRKEGKEKAGK